METPLIQVAGIRDAAEAALVQECGIRYLGFPLRLPVNREDLTEAEAEAIIRSFRPPVRGVLITYLDEAEAIGGFCRTLGARMVQLHGDISAADVHTDIEDATGRKDRGRMLAFVAEASAAFGVC
jgi:phosphoribosylanthranilate isomerase